MDATSTNRTARLRVLNVYEEILRVISKVLRGDAAENSVSAYLQEISSKKENLTRPPHVRG
jgi:hypothetical protein